MDSKSNKRRRRQELRRRALNLFSFIKRPISQLAQLLHKIVKRISDLITSPFVKRPTHKFANPLPKTLKWFLRPRGGNEELESIIEEIGELRKELSYVQIHIVFIFEIWFKGEIAGGHEAIKEAIANISVRERAASIWGDWVHPPFTWMARSPLTHLSLWAKFVKYLGISLLTAVVIGTSGTYQFLGENPELLTLSPPLFAVMIGFIVPEVVSKFLKWINTFACITTVFLIIPVCLTIAISDIGLATILSSLTAILTLNGMVWKRDLNE